MQSTQSPPGLQEAAGALQHGGNLRPQNGRGILRDLAIPAFIAPMLLQPTKVLPAGDQWLYEPEFDGCRGLGRN
jgi:ATP-dependent DNA ligase